jgi:hypothetical protein
MVNLINYSWQMGARPGGPGNRAEPQTHSRHPERSTVRLVDFLFNPHSAICNPQFLWPIG